MQPHFHKPKVKPDCCKGKHGGRGPATSRVLRQASPRMLAVLNTEWLHLKGKCGRRWSMSLTSQQWFYRPYEKVTISCWRFGFSLVMQMVKLSDRQGMVKESRTISHADRSLWNAALFCIFSSTFLCIVCLLGHGLFPLSATSTFKLKAFLTLHDSLWLCLSPGATSTVLNNTDRPELTQRETERVIHPCCRGLRCY